jgi:hypothetical protein
VEQNQSAVLADGNLCDGSVRITASPKQTIPTNTKRDRCLLITFDGVTLFPVEMIVMNSVSATRCRFIVLEQNQSTVFCRQQPVRRIGHRFTETDWPTNASVTALRITFDGVTLCPGCYIADTTLMARQPCFPSVSDSDSNMARSTFEIRQQCVLICRPQIPYKVEVSSRSRESLPFAQDLEYSKMVSGIHCFACSFWCSLTILLDPWNLAAALAKRSHCRFMLFSRITSRWHSASPVRVCRCTSVAWP